MPLGFIESSSDGQNEESRMIALVAEAPGAKQEFSYQAGLEFLTTHLHRAIPFDKFGQMDVSPRRSWGHWVEYRTEKGSPKTPLLHHERRKVDIVDRVSREPLSGVEFWGPLRTRRFGPIGFLADLRADHG